MSSIINYVTADGQTADFLVPSPLTGAGAGGAAIVNNDEKAAEFIWAKQAAGYVWSGPVSGGNAKPTFKPITSLIGTITSITWRGAWASGTSYAVNDAVSNGGGSYICTAATSGTTAPGADGAHWSLLAAQGSAGTNGTNGTTGSNGLSITWRAAWVSGTAYAVHDAVSNGGSAYICTAATGGTTAPGADGAHWSLLAAQGSAGTNGTNGSNGINGLSITWRSAWAPGTSYAVNDAVSSGGSSYICTAATSGTTAPPSDGSHWWLLAAQGSAGANGTNGTNGANGSNGLSIMWRAAWVSGTAYAVNDAVSNGGSSYICTAATSGTTAPPSDATQWSLLAAQGAAASFASPVAPASVIVNTLPYSGTQMNLIGIASLGNATAPSGGNGDGAVEGTEWQKSTNGTTWTDFNNNADPSVTAVFGNVSPVTALAIGNVTLRARSVGRIYGGGTKVTSGWQPSGAVAYAAPTSAIGRLAYIESSDLASAATANANAYTAIGSSKSFTVGSTAATIAIDVRTAVIGRGCKVGDESSQVSDSVWTLCLYVDGAFSARLSSARALAHANYCTMPGSGVKLRGLSAGSHTVQLYVHWSNTDGLSSSIFYLRPSSVPTSEFLEIDVTEL